VQNAISLSPRGECNIDVQIAMLRYVNPAAADFNGAVAFELRVARQDSGMTIEELVQRSGLNRSTMLRYFYNQRAIPVPALFQIAVALGIEPAEILSRAAARPLAERLAADGKL
jgi:hypothetical protein